MPRFDLIVHPVSNVFVPDVHPVWREAYRVLRPGGTLLAGFCNPVMYLFDQELADEGILQVRHKLPYSDLTSLTDEERRRLRRRAAAAGVRPPAGQTRSAARSMPALLIAGFYEDVWPGAKLNEYMPTYIATRAIKPRNGVDHNELARPTYPDQPPTAIKPSCSTFCAFPASPPCPSMPPTSAGPAHWVAERLAAAGMENIETLETGGHPVVYADWLHAPGKPTIMIYGHFDTQPVDPIGTVGQPAL